MFANRINPGSAGPGLRINMVYHMQTRQHHGCLLQAPNFHNFMINTKIHRSMVNDLPCKPGSANLIPGFSSLSGETLSYGLAYILPLAVRVP